MTINIGDKLPDVTLTIMGDDGPEPVTTGELFGGKRIVLFGVPGAFTPTCHKTHLPGYIEKSDALMEAGVEGVICLAVNDVFVLKAWEEASGSGGKVQMISDGNAAFTKATGLGFDGSAFGLGTRAKRYSMIVNDGIVEDLNVEEAPPACEISSAEAIAEKV